MSAQEDTAARGGSQPRRKLGKGLGALLGEARREEPLVARDSEGGEGGARIGPRDGMVLGAHAAFLSCGRRPISSRASVMYARLPAHEWS